MGAKSLCSGSMRVVDVATAGEFCERGSMPFFRLRVRLAPLQ